MRKKLRPVGDITQDLEPLLFELVHDHQLQKGEVLSLVSRWISIHYPGANEEYEDGSFPIEFYGPIEALKRLTEKI